MRRVLFFLCICVLFAVPLFAQQAKPTATPDVDPVVKIATDLIQIDVTATDKSGKVVTDLKAEDFEIYENGQKQPISNFSFSSEITGVTSNATGVANAQQGGPAKPLTPGMVNRTIAIVVDDLNMSFTSVYYARRALRYFVDQQMRPGDLVAIIRTGGNVGALQQFTSDKDVLRYAIDKIRWNALGNGGVDRIPAINRTAEEMTHRTNAEIDSVMRGDPTSIRVGGRRRPNLLGTDTAREYNGTRNFNEFQEGLFAAGSIGSMSYVIQGMRDLPGRKMMMLFSDGIRINSDSTKSRTSLVYSYLQNLVDTATRASVVVYTFDTRGLASLSANASDNFDDTITDQKLAERFGNFISSQDGLVMLARETGGKSLLNSNDLRGGMQRALQEQSGYYLLGYLPDADTFDPAKRKFNKLEVKVKRPGVDVSYRSGFFNTSDPVLPTNPAAPNVEQKIAAALISPFAANQIGVNVNALFGNDPVDGEFLRSFVHIDAKNLKFTPDAEGFQKATFEIAAIAFGDNGAPADSVSSKYTIKTKGATYDSMLKNGFVYVLIMPVKKPGLYQYRVAVMDQGTGKIGTASQVVEVPNLSDGNFAVSSIGVEVVTLATWQGITQGKIGSGPGQTPYASTFLYDTVLKQYRAGDVMRWGVEVYNAKTGKDGSAELESVAKIVQNDKIVIGGQTIHTEGVQKDPKNIRVSGAVLLKDLAPGDYVLHVMVRDINSRKFSTQILPFEIVK